MKDPKKKSFVVDARIITRLKASRTGKKRDSINQTILNNRRRVPHKLQQQSAEGVGSTEGRADQVQQVGWQGRRGRGRL